LRSTIAFDDRDALGIILFLLFIKQGQIDTRERCKRQVECTWWGAKENEIEDNYNYNYVRVVERLNLIS